MDRYRRTAARGLTSWPAAPTAFQRAGAYEWRRTHQESRLHSAARPGCHLILFPKGSAGRATRLLWTLAAVRSTVASDGAGAGLPRLSAGEGVVFPAVHAGLASLDPDQVAALGVHQGTHLLSIEPERAVGVMHGADAHSAPTECPLSVHTRPLDETAVTWGLQATRASISRFSGRGIRVAILDSGLDVEHPDFAGRPIVSASFVADNSVIDTNGHGTYCAGVACGPAAAHRGPRYGVASAAELYIGKVVGDNGSGLDGSILSGIDWAVRRGCAIVSLSIGTAVVPSEPYSAIFEQVAARALAAGTLIVGAAGNASLRPDRIAPIDHPANCPSIVAVSAIDHYGRLAPFSCGAVNSQGGAVDLAAPGVAVRSAWPRPALYRTMSGTSMASAYVAGLAALMAEANAACRGRELRAALLRAARPLPFPARDVGVGLVQAP